MDYIYIAAIISLLSVLCYYYLTKNYGYWEKRCVPYLKDTIPGLGNTYPLVFLQKNVIKMYEEFYNRMPGCSMVGFYFGRQPALLVRDPELVKSVLQTKFLSFGSNGKTFDPEVDRLLSTNPLLLQGEQWKSARQHISSAFTTGKLKYMYESIDAVSEKLVKYLDDKIEKGNGEVEVELKELFSRYTAEVVASAAFGLEGNSFKDDEDGTFTEMGKTIFKPSFTKGIKQLVVVFLPFIAKLIDTGMIPYETDKLFRNLVKDMLKYRKDHNVQRPDFLQLMINLKKTGASDHSYAGGEFDDATITSHSASFFLEGYETSSITLSFVFYQLASHPEIQQRVRDEVLTLAKKHDGITYEAIQEMSYMDKVINESMRVHAPTGVLLKVCTEKTDLKGPDGITCQVMPGTRVMISLNGLHNDPEHWPDPEKFDPERFSEENKLSRHRFTYIPFGEGPRICVGMRMAMLQVKAAIATTIKNYTLEVSPKTQLPLKLDPHFFLTSAIGGLWAKLKPL